MRGASGARRQRRTDERGEEPRRLERHLVEHEFLWIARQADVRAAGRLLDESVEMGPLLRAQIPDEVLTLGQRLLEPDRRPGRGHVVAQAPE